MSAELSSASFTFKGASAPKENPVRRDVPTRFNLLLMGEFSGDANRRATPSTSAGRLVRVDCDNYEQVLAEFGAGLSLTDPSARGEGVTLRFSSLDDFHPDRLLTNAASLAPLIDARRLLSNPATVEQGS